MDLNITCILTKHYMAFYVWLPINFWGERDTYYQNIKNTSDVELFHFIGACAHVWIALDGPIDIKLML